jgi:hypothetical protein
MAVLCTYPTPPDSVSDLRDAASVSVDSWVLQAFPATLEREASRVASVLPPAAYGPLGSFDALVDGQRLTIPYRIYNDEPSAQDVGSLGDARVVAACLYTRHADGLVRQRHLRSIIHDLSPWVLPFVVQLVGEYVVEIVQDIAQGLDDVGSAGSPQQRAYGSFLVENPELLRKTHARVVSYWNCCYRHRYPNLQDYPGHQVASSLTRATRIATQA